MILKSVFIIMIAFVFSIFTISLGVIPADAVEDYLGYWGTISFGNNEDLREGEILSITLRDQDHDKNEQIAETISISTAYDLVTAPWCANGASDNGDDGVCANTDNVLNLKEASIPFLKIGNPVTIQPRTFAGFFSNEPSHATLAGNSVQMTKFSSSMPYTSPQDHVVIVTTPSNQLTINNGDELFISPAFELEDFLKRDLDTVSVFLNYNVKSLNDKLSSGQINSISIIIENNIFSKTLLTTSDLTGYIQIPKSDLLDMPWAGNVYGGLKIVFEDVSSGTTYDAQTRLPIAVDFFSFGTDISGNNFSQNNDIVNDAIYRLEPIETSIDSAIFMGTLEFIRLTDKNIMDAPANLVTFGDSLKIGIHSGYYSNIGIGYMDRDPTGASTYIGEGVGVNVRASFDNISVTTVEDTPVIINIDTDDFMGTSFEMYDYLMSSYINGIRHPLNQLEALTDQSLWAISNTEFCTNISNEGFDKLHVTNFKYVPEEDFSGIDTFTIQRISEYVFCEYMDTNPLTISVTVTPVNDAPITIGSSVTIQEDVSENITLLGTDVDGDTLSYVVIEQPSHGTLSGTGKNLNYVSDLNYFGVDEFTFKTSDGQLDGATESVSITINPVADIPIANANADQSVDVNSVVSLDGSQSYDYDLEDVITYSWIQTAGDPVTLTDSTISNPQFTAPSGNGQVTFMLTVSDSVATSNPDVVNIYVGSLVPEATAPPAPTSLSSNPSDSTVVLNWQTPDDGGSTITDYVVEYKSANSSWSTYDDGVSSNTVSIISGLENNVSYQFRISAVNSVGTSDSSS
jgi:hypothetical protein